VSNYNIQSFFPHPNTDVATSLAGHPKLLQLETPLVLGKVGYTMLADRTNGRAIGTIGTVLRLSVAVCRL